MPAGVPGCPGRTHHDRESGLRRGSDTVLRRQPDEYLLGRPGDLPAYGQDADLALAAVRRDQLAGVCDGDLRAGTVMSEQLIPGVVEQEGTVQCNARGKDGDGLATDDHADPQDGARKPAGQASPGKR